MTQNALAKADPVGMALASFNPQNFNLLVPITKIDQLPDMHRLSVREVHVDAETETYKIPGGELGKEKVALGKVALDKIAMAAGIQWIPNQCGRTDDGRDPYLVTYRVTGLIRNFDGQSVVIGPKEKTVDLRGEPGWPDEKLGADTREFIRVADKKTPSRFEIPTGTKSSTCKDCGAQAFWVKTQGGKNVLVDPDGLCHFDTCSAKAAKGPAGWDRVFQARAHILSLAESKAKNRCIREALAIPVAMTKEQAAKPFVVASLVLAPDMSDPDVKRAAIAHMFGASSALYGPAPAAMGPRPVNPPAHDPVTIEAQVVDNETGEVLEVDDITAAGYPPPEASEEPWDQKSAPPAPRRFKLSAEELIALDPVKASWFKRLNELCQAVYDRFGDDVGKDHLAATFPVDWDPATSPATIPSTEVAKIGSALKALGGG